MSKADAKNSHTIGHRERMRTRLNAKGASTLTDQEVLEMLLYFVIQRRDVKPIAKDLFAKFKNFNTLVKVSDKELRTVKGIGKSTSLSSLFQLLEEVSVRMAREQIQKMPILSNWAAVEHYCVVKLHLETVEQLLVLFLDKQNRLIKDEILQKGTIDKTAIFPREIVKMALHYEASALILAHNHPSQNPNPSHEDIEITHRVRDALAAIEVKLHDHLIVAGNKCISFKSEQLL